MTYAEAVARLTALRGGEVAGMQPGLDRIEALLDALGRPERRATLIQVGGTNGKGSTAAMIAAILQAAGRRVGLYTSPHLVSFRERIRVNGAPISPDALVDGVETLGTLVARLDASMFEATTALALDHFAREAVDVAVLEVGLGGRLDATTVGTPVATVLARIDLDHEEILGKTLGAIAAEKAAIIRSGVAISAAQAPEAGEVVAARAREAGVPLLVEGRDLAVTVEARDRTGQRVTCTGPGWRLADLHLPLLGTPQPGNALLAVTAALATGAGASAVREGLPRVRWPGRFQVVEGDPVLVLDGAHNPAGVRALVASLRTVFGDTPVTLVVGVSRDKDARAMLETLAPAARRIILTRASNTRAAEPGALALALPPGTGPAETAASVPEALALARRPPATPVVCVTGSLFVVGEVLARLPGVPGGPDPIVQ